MTSHYRHEDDENTYNERKRRKGIRRRWRSLTLESARDHDRHKLAKRQTSHQNIWYRPVEFNLRVHD